MKMAISFEEKVKELSEDKEFLEKVCTIEDPEQIKALFLEKDVEMDDDAAKAFVEKVRSMDGKELNEAELENVSGGVLGICAVSTIVGWACVGAAGGVVLGVCLVLAYYYYKKIKNG